MADNSGPGYKQYPDHRVDLQRGPDRVQVLFDGERIADSSDVITVKETGHDPVYYFPREDVQMQRFVRSDHHTQCPFKGEASYYSLSNERTVENAAWSYEGPYDEVAEIKDRLAFYPENIEFITELEKVVLMPQRKEQKETWSASCMKFKHGELETSRGKKVKSPKQAIAIGLREAGASKYESDEENKENLKNDRV